jgi:hypothetical protein
MNITAEEAERYKKYVGKAEAQLGNQSLRYITLEMKTDRAIKE